MENAPLPEPGYEPGLRFACLLDGKGGAKTLRWHEIDRWRPQDGVLWLHLERDHPQAQHWIRAISGIEPVIAEALIAEESRPRVESFDDALLMVLRGVCQVEKGCQYDFFQEGVDLVPVHIWINGQRVISIRDQDHTLNALRDIRTAHLKGIGPTRPGELLTQIADKIVKDLEPLLDGMDDELDQLENQMADGDDRELRVQLSQLRRRAIHLRRYLSPQRDALNRLQREETSWLNQHDKVVLREVIDKVLRYIEYLDSIRDRSTILHEDLSAMVHERVARTSNRLTALAALVLPPSLIAGLLGMNVGGLPANADPLGFYYVIGFVVGLSALVYWLLRRANWL